MSARRNLDENHAERLRKIALKIGKKEWLRGLDSNQDSRLQRPMCYQLHHPGVVEKV